MSMSIEIKVSETETRTIHVEDGIKTHLHILSVTTPEETSTTLAQELESNGFEKTAEGTHKRVDDGITTEIDTKTHEIVVKIEKDSTLSRTASDKIRGYDDTENANDARKEEMREELKNRINKTFSEEEKKIQQELTEKLEKHLDTLRTELDVITTNVVKTNLRKKAESMGQVLEISEDDSGNMTIKVSV